MNSDESAAMRRIAESRKRFALIDARAADWIAGDQGQRKAVADGNRKWFAKHPTHESSVFLYFDLAGNRAAVERAREVQRICAKILGEDGFNPAPADRLHATILTDLVTTVERIADGRVLEVSQKYAGLLAQMRPSPVFVLGPHLTCGGVVLECQIHEETLFETRAAAAAPRRRGDGPGPRVPDIEYATLGYLTNSEREALERLNSELGRIRDRVEPITVDVDKVRISRTVNKRIVEPTVSHELAAARGFVPGKGGRDSDDIASSQNKDSHIS